MSTDLTFKQHKSQHGCCDANRLDSVYESQLMFLRVPTSFHRTESFINTLCKADDLTFLRSVNAMDAAFTDWGAPVCFRQESTELFRNDRSNDQTLLAIDEVLGVFKKNKRVSLSKISLIGLSSLEEDPEINFGLSEKRARALRDEILFMHPEIKASQFELFPGGENWPGLRNLVEKTEMCCRNEILEIIDNTPEGLPRKLELQNLKGGVPYRSMLKLIYPQLRDACYISVWFEEKPDLETKIIHHAVNDLELNRIDDAIEQLQTIEYDKRSWNALGICYLIKGDIAKASQYLVHSIDAGKECNKSGLLLICAKEADN